MPLNRARIVHIVGTNGSAWCPTTTATHTCSAADLAKAAVFARAASSAAITTSTSGTSGSSS